MKLRHARLDLELHELRDGGGPALLLLHALGGSSQEWSEPKVNEVQWSGRVLALDFSGHGDSGRVRGGCYTPELLGADVGLALREVGPCALAGAGLGAYVALLVAGARPGDVPAALLLPGRGLDGGGPEPDFERDPSLDEIEIPFGTDPATRLLASDIRPVDYATSFAGEARTLLFAEDGSERPPWWIAARQAPRARAVTTEPRAALAELHRATLSAGGDT